MDVEGFHVCGVNLMALVVVADPECARDVHFPTSPKDDHAIQRIASQRGIYIRTAPLIKSSQPKIRAHDDGGLLIVEVSHVLIVSWHEFGINNVREVDTSAFVTQAGKYWLISICAAGDDGHWRHCVQ